MNLFIDFRPVHQIIPTDFEHTGQITQRSIEGLDFDAAVDLITETVLQHPGTKEVFLIFDSVQKDSCAAIIKKLGRNEYSYIIATPENKVDYSQIGYSLPWDILEEAEAELGIVTVVPVPNGGAYEWYLHTWGGIYNENILETRYGIKGCDFWFNSAYERSAFIARLLGYAKESGECLMYATQEGMGVRYKPVITMTLTTPDGKTCKHTDSAWYGYNILDLLSAWVDGNHCCDCNRSFAMQRAGIDIEDYPCGFTIKASDVVLTFSR